MQFSAIVIKLWYILLLSLCLVLSSSSASSSLSSTSSSSLLCLRPNNSSSGSNALSLQHPVRRYLDETQLNIDSLPVLAATKAHLSPVVFRGTLLSVLVQRDGTVRAAFGVDQALKASDGVTGVLPADVAGQMDVVYFQKSSRSGEECVFDVNEDNLRLGNQYVVYGRFLDETRTSVIATAFPIEYERKTFKAIKRVVCRGCAKPPRVEGLSKNVKIAERRKLRLQCHLSGNPIPWVEWYKNGQPIANGGRIKVRTRRRTTRLIIRQSRLQDSGVYECRAVNVVQKFPAVAKTTVIVTRKSTKKPRIKTPTTAPTVSSLWPTAACPNSDFCLNGGTCIFYRDVREYVCHCADGFVGLRCDYKDVRASLGGVKNMERDHNRLFVTIVLLFIFLSCLNWGSLIACWICCFRKQGTTLRETMPINNLLNFARRAKEKRSQKANVAGESLCEGTFKRHDEIDQCVEDEYNLYMRPSDIMSTRGRSSSVRIMDSSSGPERMALRHYSVPQNLSMAKELV